MTDTTEKGGLQSPEDENTLRMACRMLLLASLLFAAVPVLAQDDLRSIPDADPGHQLEMLHAAEGFEVNLFASEPMLVKPIQMNWDAEGRLWVVGSATYPQLKPGEIPNDKIYVLEDTDGDGAADKSTVFADGLLMPTGILPGDGGAYVANSTELIHLSDTDGDGKADKRRVVLSGFGTADTHHLINTFKWGPEGKLYFNQAIYIFSHVETPWGMRRLEGGGTWQLRPETLDLEVFSRGLVNPWGLQFGRWGASFLTDGAGGEGLNYAFPGATFTASPGAERFMPGLNPGQPKHSGLEVVSGRHLPASWEGNFITNDYRANRINRFVVEEQGSGFVSTQAEDLLWTDHVAFRPVDVTVGPDGALYVADWYNPIIQHGEVDFRDPRRDQQHGRIWRITAKDQPLVTPPRLAGAGVMDLLEALKLPENWTRAQAKQELKELGTKAVVPALEAWTGELDASEADYEHHLLEALWVYQALDVVNESLLGKLLNAGEHNARAAAVRVLSSWQDRIGSAAGELLVKAASDEHPRVRLEAVVALRGQAHAEAAKTALSVLDQPMDSYLDFALWQTVRELEPYWMEKVQADPDYFAGADKAAFALKSAGHPDAVPYLMQLYSQGQVPAAYRDDVLEAVAERGGIGEINQLFNLAVGNATLHDEGRVAYFHALEEAMNRQTIKPDQDTDRLAPFISDEEEAVAVSAVRLAGNWQKTGFRDRLEALATGPNETLQQAALSALSAFDDEPARHFLAGLTGAEHPHRLRMQAAAQLVSFDVEQAARMAVAVLGDLPRGTDASELFSSFLSRANRTRALAGELSATPIPAWLANAGMQAIQQHIPSNRRDSDDTQALRKALEASGGKLPPERMPQELTDQQINILERDVRTTADPEKGELIYRRNALMCQNCHALGGAGGLAGPDLSSLGTSAPTDNIIRALLSPNANVKEGYTLTRVERTDGSQVMGTLIRETPSEIVLRNAADQPVSIPAGQVASRQIMQGSLMPPGLTASLEREEFIDLVGFLSSLGEPGDYRGAGTQMVRRWRTLADSPETRELIREHGPDYPARESGSLQWRPAYSLVSGDLPSGNVPVVEVEADRKFSYVWFEVEVLSAGNVELSFKMPGQYITGWSGSEQLSVQDHTAGVRLGEGIHRITLAVDRNMSGEQPLNIELIESGQDAARARPVTGK
ncbi:MAG: PVC-type heme-binding CxxCH protein [Balneolales bacterium]